ncbi:MAG: MmcQ/YjbR family DNA-binding protein [Thermoanaerobaculia bacterium]|nr:MmcQ/YjbR family DNA-binding protein [Thermoanaerobaculia bacterium]
MNAPAAVRKIEEKLREHALTFPEVVEDFPWGHRAFKVNKKAFVFLSLHDDEVSISVKLPQSRDMAADLPFTEPTGYGLGKHGWVTAHLRPKEKPPLDLLKSWINESYRAIAPKKLVAKLALPSR